MEQVHSRCSAVTTTAVESRFVLIDVLAAELSIIGIITRRAENLSPLCVVQCTTHNQETLSAIIVVSVKQDV